MEELYVYIMHAMFTPFPQYNSKLEAALNKHPEVRLFKR